MRSLSLSRVGYKTEVKQVKKQIQHEPAYEMVEEAVSTPITDCDLKSGKYTLADIEVPA